MSPPQKKLSSNSLESNLMFSLLLKFNPFTPSQVRIRAIGPPIFIYLASFNVVDLFQFYIFYISIGTRFIRILNAISRNRHREASNPITCLISGTVAYIHQYKFQ